MVHISVTGDTTGRHEPCCNSLPSGRPLLSRSIEWDLTLDLAWTKSHTLTSTLLVHRLYTAAVSGVAWPTSDAFIIRGILSLTVIVDCLGGSLELPRVLSPTGVLLQHIQLWSIPTLLPFARFCFLFIQSLYYMRRRLRQQAWGEIKWVQITYSIQINFLIYSIFCNYCLHRLYKSVMFLFRPLNSAIYPQKVNFITHYLQILPGIFK